MRIGIDLGGTKIEGIAIADDGKERLRRRIVAPRGDYEHTIAAVAGLVNAIEEQTGARGTVGIGVFPEGCRIDPTTLPNSSTTALLQK